MNEEIAIGTTINELTILSYCERPKRNKKYKSYGGPWVRCKCSCGKKVVAPLYGIKNNFIKSCGHYKGQNGGKNLKQYYETHDATNATYLTIDGETKNITEWSEISGVPRTTLLYRLSKHVPLNKLFDKGSLNDTDDWNQSEPT